MIKRIKFFFGKIKSSIEIKEILILVIIFVFGLTPLIWFKDGLIIAGGDHLEHLDASNLFYYYSFSWNAKFNEGSPNLNISQVFPYILFWVVLKKIGLSLVNIEKMWSVLTFLLPGFFIYYLIKTLNKNRENFYLSGIIAAFLYMFNLYLVLDPIHEVYRLVQAFLPLMLAFWIKGLEEPNFSLKYSVYIGITSIFFTSSYLIPPVVSVIPLTLFSYLIFFFFNNRSKIVKGLKFAFITLIITIFINFWWMIVYFPSAIQISKSMRKVKGFTALDTGPLLEFFRFLGSWSWKLKGYELPYFPYVDYYDRFPLLFLTFLLSVIIFSSIFFLKRYKNISYFIFLSLLGLFLVKGTHSPFGEIYNFFYHNIPGFWTFREPYTKFTLLNIFSLSVLLGYSVDGIYKYIKSSNFIKKKRYIYLIPNIFVILIILTILTISFPMFTGETIWNEKDGNRRTLHVMIPEYWTDIQNWFEKNDNKNKIFMAPKGGLYNSPFNWEHGFSSTYTPAKVLFKNPILFFDSEPLTYANRLINSIFENLNPENMLDSSKILSLLNVKYILQQNDLNWEFGSEGTLSPVDMKKILQNQEGFNKKKSFGKLDLYEIDDDFFIPKIYIPHKIIYFQGGIGDIEYLAKISSFNEFNGESSIIFSEFLDNNDIQTMDYISHIFLTANIQRNKDDTNWIYKIDVLSMFDYKVYFRNSESFEKHDVDFIVMNMGGNKKKIKIKDIDIRNEEWIFLDNLILDIGSHEIEISFFDSMGREKPSIKLDLAVKYDRENVEKPEIVFKEINPTKYNIQVKEAKYPYLLVLSENFNRNWKLYLNGKPVLEKDHLIINGFANSWFISEKGDYNLTIEYLPQRYMNFGVLLSISTIFLSLSYLVYSYISKKRNKILK
ncbi:MAG: DUF3367 domain-containing protein [Actinobacteria bacterium]|nr:DUF3367 domain-containing protein [Actinomycetota bacterium]